MSPDSISTYISALDPQRAAVCERLCKSIDAALPQATGKLWHAIPVWFIGENVAVGFTARKTGVMLMFWNGQHFDEPELEASGSFHMAQIAYEDPAQIDEQKLARWLKAGTSIWDAGSAVRLWKTAQGEIRHGRQGCKGGKGGKGKGEEARHASQGQEVREALKAETDEARQSEEARNDEEKVKRGVSPRGRSSRGSAGNARPNSAL
jgi:hypothetical protein